MFWTIPMRTTSSGGSSSAAASRKTIEVWNDRSFDWNRTVKSWAIAAAVPRIAKVSQPSTFSPRTRSRMKGVLTATVSAITDNRYAVARPESGFRCGASSRSAASTGWRSLGMAVMPTRSPHRQDGGRT